MSKDQPIPGQRWVSDSEPELGLGIILKAEFGRVEVLFPAASETRQYALKSAPLRRVEFKEGERIKLHGGEELLVEDVETRGGLFVYRAAGRTVAEAELSDTISFSTPEDRLLAGQVDDLRTFDLRVEALARRSEMRQSPVRGFAGGRVDLIPHQMFIAGEVASRLAPRVLLADEVGLGKTIEACLILHRLHLTGRAERVLILVPEPLIHQWFVELLRRFNLLFSIFDEARCASIQLHDAEANPFLDSQLVLCSVGLLAEDRARAAQVLAAGWDLLVVDEAHHLEWSPKGASPQYALVEALAQRTNGLLLLTATPQQLGPEGHFARLRLLDPDRYSDLAAFLAESEHYEHVARAIDRVIDGKPLSKADRELFGEKSPRIRRRCEELVAGDETARTRLVSELLDEFGTGRVMFRNTRAALSGFPERKALLAPLDGGANATGVKVKWLVGLLKELGQEKVLLICRTRELAEEIYERLRHELNVACGLFHEGLTLLQRDRNAAFFAEEEGARILLCSEIGSEGRNFQFAHHLVLFDLPENPELLEQRIGRLDRIGQTALIKIHVPYLRGSESEVLARWYHEGLNAFEKNLHGATELARVLGEELSALRESFSASGLTKLIGRSREQHAKVAKKLERGHDRLLELNSCQSAPAAETIRQVRELDADVEFEEFFVGLLDHFGVHVEEFAPRSYLLHPGPQRTEVLPSLPEAGMSVTFDRARALSREDLGFVSRDHPLVRGALDLLLGAESGNAAFGVWKTPGAESILLEVHAVVECVAPAALHADRFLPATPLRIVVDHALADHTDDAELAAAHLEKGDIFRLLDRGAVKKKLLPAMLEKAKTMAAERMSAVVDAAASAMEVQLRDEIERLEDLREINDHIRPDEIAALRQQKADLHNVLTAARLRLDALRVIFRIP
jgi:ATP-dependent helicase HepA